MCDHLKQKQISPLLSRKTFGRWLFVNGLRHAQHML